MDGWGDAEARTWLAMDLLAPVHDLWAIEPGDDASSAVQELAEGLLGEHRPELTEAALAGLLDLERALVVGAALEMVRGLVEPDVLALVECALVDEACLLPLLPLVNAAADLVLALEREAAEQGGSVRPSDVRAAPTRGDATDGDDRPGELRAGASMPGAPRSGSPDGAPSAGPLGPDAARERRSSRRCAVLRDTKPDGRARPSARRARRRTSRRHSRGPPCSTRSVPHGERRAHEARPG